LPDSLLPSQNFFGGRIESGDAAFGVGDDHRIVKRINGRFGHLARHDQFPFV
jgi:hypothetical protein